MRRTAPRTDGGKLSGKNGKLYLGTRLMQGNIMKTFVLILVMFATPLAAQDKQSHNTAPPQTAAQSASGQAVQHPQAVAKSTTKPVQPQPIVFTAKQLNEYGNDILDRSETFYNNRMIVLLWVMGIIMAAGGVIVGILIPVFLERQRKRSFEKEMAVRLQEFKEHSKKQTEELRTELISQIDNRVTELEKTIYTPLSMAFGGIGGLVSKDRSPEWYNFTLQCFVLSKKFSIISQTPKASLSATQIIELLENRNKGDEFKLETLKAVDEVIEGMKEDAQKIIDDEKRVDMESQVKELQIYVCALIHEKQQNTPPQAGHQEDKGT